MTDEQKEPIDNEALGELRDKIDDVDRRLIELLNTRAKLVVDVGKLKRGKGIPIYAPHREAAVLAKVIGLNEGPLPERTIEAIYREMMSGSFFLEQPLRIGYLGPKGSYCHIAAMRHFGSSVEFEDLRAAEGAFVEVARGHVDYALAPIENTTGGGITETLDAFARYHDSVNIYGEVQLEVHRCLLSNAQPHEINRIYATRSVFGYCRKWLAVQFPHAELHETASTTDAVGKAIGDGADHSAAIGSALAGEIHGLHVLFPDIEDEPNNITRFLILSKQKALPSGNDKTSIMFTTTDKSGALVAVLSVFDNAGINLTHIDKRPSGRLNWEYKFFIDAQGHRDDPSFASVIDDARSHCRELTELGSYPVSRRVL
ncbi:MAG: chorismate mutase [Planctomycetota bacterium]